MRTQKTSSMAKKMKLGMMSTRSSDRLRAKTASAENVANNEDLLTEVFLRLPTKSLLKCKLVSKQWLKLISSPHFSISHYRSLVSRHFVKPQALLLDVIYKKKHPNLMFLPLNPEFNRIPPFDFVEGQRIRVLQSCSGLLLCVSMKGDENPSYCLCNPAIRKMKIIYFPMHQVIYTTLSDVAYQLGVNPVAVTFVLKWNKQTKLDPPVDSVICERRHFGVNLAFDPLRSPHYKILSIWRQESIRKDPESSNLYRVRKYFIDIYFSETDSWSVHKMELDFEGVLQISHAVFFNGAIHWDCLSHKEGLYLDVDNECFKTMPMPEQTTEGQRYFGESEGHLHLVFTLGEYPILNFRIFEMEIDYSSWFLKYDLNVEVDKYVDVPLRSRSYYPRYLLSCTLQYDAEKGDCLMVVLPGGKAISYNFKDGKVEMSSCSNIDKYRFDRLGRCRASCLYFETLCCV